MRNNPIVFPKFTLTGVIALLSLSLMPFLTGCMDGPSRGILNRGYNEMTAQKYDSADADADEFLRAHPDGSGTAEAYYLKGRIDEAKALDDAAAPTDADKRDLLDRAKEAYLQGLQAGGPANVRAQLHTGVANVDFYEEDYTGAVREWTSSYENIPGDDTKAWVLYQIGRSQQRLGEFDEADKTFKRVVRDYPNSDRDSAAARAAARIGMNAFYVQVKKYGTVPTAEKAAGDLRTQGFPASRVVDGGWQIVHIGPLPTYNDAKTVQAKIAREYPVTIISP